MSRRRAVRAWRPERRFTTLPVERRISTGEAGYAGAAPRQHIRSTAGVRMGPVLGSGEKPVEENACGARVASDAGQETDGEWRRGGRRVVPEGDAGETAREMGFDGG